MQLDVRGVEQIARALEARIELLDLRHDALGFGLLRADRGVCGRPTCRDRCRSEGEDDDRSLSLQSLDDVSRRSPGASAPGLPHVTRWGR
jgi:hypothetical protein